MPTRTPRRCAAPGCGAHSTSPRGRCPKHLRKQPSAVAAEYDDHWARRVRLPYLVANPACVLCGHLATVADHWPDSRTQLVGSRVTDPDAWHRLRPLCVPCHGRETLKHQPSAWQYR
jgi:5-methylcytosine-specific restriction protein A